MSLKAKQPNTKPRQFEILVDFMQQHTDLAKGPVKGVAAKLTSDQLWKRLAEELNLNGPPIHTFVEWKKIWVDYKNHIKSKLRKNRLNISGTGGGPSKLCSFTNTEEQVITLMSMEDAVNGIPKTTSFGADFFNDSNVLLNYSVNSPENNINNAIEERSATVYENKTSLNDVNSKTTMRPWTMPIGRENLLKVQVENQVKYQKDSVEKLTEICEHLKSQSRYARKNFELKEKKLALAKEKFEFKKKKENDKRKFRSEKLELKKKILELELQKLP